MKTMFSLQGKVAIVTGSDRGIGKGIALVLARAGAKIVITSLHVKDCERTASNIAKLGVATLAIVCDVSKEKDVQNLVAQTVRKFGRLDIFVNNAGVLFRKPMDEISEKEWDWLTDINLKGVFFGTKHASIQMKKQGNGGSIINISSIAGLVGYSSLSTYCASKGGILAFSRASALELSSYKIRVNVICPGPIETAMTKDINDDPKMREDRIRTIPLHFIGQPEDIGYGALYLASDEARYVTGASFVIDGGWTAP